MSIDFEQETIRLGQLLEQSTQQLERLRKAYIDEQYRDEKGRITVPLAWVMKKQRAMEEIEELRVKNERLMVSELELLDLLNDVLSTARYETNQCSCDPMGYCEYHKRIDAAIANRNYQR